MIAGDLRGLGLLDLTWSTPAALAAKSATTTIPIVFAGVGDPVRTGLVASLARPGANVSGFSTLAEELSGKRLELLRETVPKVGRVAMLWNSTKPRHGVPCPRDANGRRQVGSCSSVVRCARAE